jgi:hypothetical protein
VTIPETVAPELGELIDTPKVLAGGGLVWLLETRPAQPEIAKLNARTSGPALRGFFCKSLSHNLYECEFLIRTCGLPSFEFLAERTPHRIFFTITQAIGPRL